MEYKFVLLFAVGSVAGFINVMAGGGSALTLPALIFLGLDSAMANGTNRIALFIQNISAVSSFKKNKTSEFKKSLKFAAFTLPGAILGAIVAVNISHALFQRILGVVIIGIMISLFVSPATHKTINEKKNILVYPALFGIGIYGGFIQAGVGFIIIASLYHILHINLVKVNMHKVFIILVYTIPALAIFIYTGNVHWVYGFSLAAGNAVGAWWGAHVAVKGGDRVIKIFLVITMVIMAFKLFGVF